MNPNIINMGKTLFDVFVNVEKLIKYLIYNFIIKGYKESRILPLSNSKILIVGNGPSSKDIDLQEVSKKGISILCVNYFASQNKDFLQIKPRYYCIIDPAFYNDKYGYTDETENLINILNNVNWDMTYICLSNQNLSRLQNPHINVVNLNKIEYTGRYWKYTLYSNNKANFGFQNVILAALYFCITADAQEIYLCGVDSDWHRELFVDENNVVYREDRHFYGVNRINLITKGEIKVGEFYKYIGYYYNTMREFYYSSQYATYKKVNIYNLTLNSFIDVYEKKSIDEILK